MFKKKILIFLKPLMSELDFLLEYTSCEDYKNKNKFKKQNPIKS